MTQVSRSIPGLFGGVSQQIPALRHPTQGSAQDNGYATLVDGLYKRPGSRHVASLALNIPGGLSVSGSLGNAKGHVIDRGALGRHQLILVNSSLMLYDLSTGAAQSIDSATGFSYLNTPDPANDFKCLTVADYTFIVNTRKVPAMSGAAAPARAANVAYVNVRIATPKVIYTIVVEGVPCAITSGEYPTNAEIAGQLRARIAAAVPSVSAYVVPGTNVVKITKGSGTINVSCSDGWGNTGLQNVSEGVDKYSDLPAKFEASYTVTVRGATESNRDNYFVEWDGKSWVETIAPGLQTAIAANTMPHQLRPKGDGTWMFEPAPAWEPRKVGDESTNPTPSFIGKPIRGVFFHRNRLGFLAGDNAILSRAGSYYAFWSTTAQQTLDTDPIDLSASNEGVDTLESVVPYNKSLLVWSSGKQQFVLVGGDILTPTNARLMPTTTFKASGCPPVAMGNKIIYTAPTGTSSQLRQYRVSEDRTTDTSDDLTEHVPQYLPATVRSLAASEVMKTVVALPTEASKTLTVFKYETTEDDKLSQKAWQRFTFERLEDMRFIAAHWVDSKLYLLIYTKRPFAPDSTGHFTLESIDFSPALVDADAGFPVRLDRMRRVDATFDGTYYSTTLPYATTLMPTLLHCRPGFEPQAIVPEVISPATAMSTVIKWTPELAGGTLYMGDRFTFIYEFTEPVMQDRDGTPYMASTLKHVKTFLRYEDTGYFRAEVTPLNRPTYTYPFVGRMTGQPGQGASLLGLSTGVFQIPVQTKAADVKVRLVSDSYLPCRFPYAEWMGDVTVKAQR